MPNFIYARGYSKLPYDTIRYTASTNYFLACAESLGTLIDIDYIDIPNAIVVAFHLSGTSVPVMSAY